MQRFSSRPRSRRNRASAVVSVALWLAAAGCITESPQMAPRPKCGGTGRIADLPDPTPVWTHASASSVFYTPRVVDLEDDGVLEVLLAGGNEQPAFGELVALDAATGLVRWQAYTEHELYSLPVLLDVDGDGVKDVFAAGRDHSLIAFDGASGSPLWSFADVREMPEFGFHNFYTPIIIPDQTGDGLPDLLVANGGDDGFPLREPRPPGFLMVVSSSDGTLVSYALLPDSRETYMSPILIPDDGAASPTILFGTGGEWWAGSLWETPLSAVLAGDLSGATKLVTNQQKGMIAPPALADLDGDGRLDIIVATFDGRLMALSGTTKEVLWQRTVEGAESYTTPAIGYFDGDDTPDVYAVFLHGAFPNYSSAERVLLSGRDGSVIWRGEAGDFAMAGDVAVDLNGDKIDDVIFIANTLQDPLTGRATPQQLYVVDGARRQARAWGTIPGGFAAGSPWVGDVDGDGCLDMVIPRHSQAPGTSDGLLTRFRVAAPVPPNIRWGSYLGTNSDSRAQPPP